MKVGISPGSIYPAYDLDEDKPKEFEVSPVKVMEWKRAMRVFREVQEEMREAYQKGPVIPPDEDVV